MSATYTHLELGEDYPAGIAGYFTPQKETRLDYRDREVLYVVGQAVIESSCCGIGSWGYVLVPGYVVNWQTRKNEGGLPVSEVEPISDEETQNNLKQIIQDREDIPRIVFW